ncbi:MAG: hypothetical protein ACOX6T_22780 [Myxococcales bacterium]|jgi:hypothetical protein
MTTRRKSPEKARKSKATSRPAGEQNIEPELYSQIAEAIRRMQPGYCVRA